MSSDTTSSISASAEEIDCASARPSTGSRARAATPSGAGKKPQRVPPPSRTEFRRPSHAREKLTIAEVCDELKVSRSTFYYWRQIGKAPRCLVLPNREVRVYRSDLDDWLDSCSEAEA